MFCRTTTCRSTTCRSDQHLLLFRRRLYRLAVVGIHLSWAGIGTKNLLQLFKKLIWIEWRNISATERTLRLEIPYEDFGYKKFAIILILICHIGQVHSVNTCRIWRKCWLGGTTSVQGRQYRGCWRGLLFVYWCLRPSALCFHYFISGEIRPCYWLFQWTTWMQFACSSRGRPIFLRKTRLVNLIHGWWCVLLVFIYYE